MPVNSNTCKCPKPPGGQVICEPNQVAICRIKNGELETLCITPPGGVALSFESMRQNEDFISQLMFEITSNPKWTRYLYESDIQEALSILEQGYYINPETNERTNFQLPDEFTGAVFAEAGGGGFSSSGGTATR
jgi:hypothetical protein